MRRISSWLIVAAVAALGVAAGVSSLLDGDKVARPVPPAADEGRPSTGAAEVAASPESGAAARELERQGALGVLYFTDERCHLHALRLPDLSPQVAPELTTCRFGATASKRPEPRALVWQPGGRLVALCEAGRTKVFDPRAGGASRSSERMFELEGCAPAWKPSGELTLVHAGELDQLDEQTCAERGAQCTRVLVSRRDLEAGFRRTPSLRRLRGPALEEVAFLSADTFIAILSARGPSGSRRELVALFQGDRLVTAPRLRDTHLSLLRVSPRRRFAAVQGDTSALWLLRARGRSLTLERFPPWSPPAPTDVRAIAWSPDERWMAVASRSSVYLFRTTRTAEGFIGLPVQALDLAWVSR
jgi:hypothetical protein